ncbi:MAG: DegV family protein [Coriobacteriia bacterium]|jgi:DegV family protein with EDD domain|nr:DegV family protein [Coriobacteriia bacterium]
MSEDASLGRIAVVTDSTSDLPDEICDQYGITRVPLDVIIDGQTWLDGEMSQQEFFDRMKVARALPTTSQPSAGAFVDVYTKLLDRFSHVVSVHISSDLSGTIASAQAGAEQFANKVTVFDSRNLSWGLGFQVIEAAKAARAGETLDSVMERLAKVRERVQMLVGVDNLENLVKGGRVGKVAGFLGSMLNLKVTFTVTDGVFEPVARTRGAKAALAHTLDWVESRMGGTRRGAFCVLHALSEDRARWLADELLKRFDVSEMHIVPTGSVIATHTGTGWAVAFVPEV